MREARTFSCCTLCVRSANQYTHTYKFFTRRYTPRVEPSRADCILDTRFTVSMSFLCMQCLLDRELWSNIGLLIRHKNSYLTRIILRQLPNCYQIHSLVYSIKWIWTRYFTLSSLHSICDASHENHQVDAVWRHRKNSQFDIPNTRRSMLQNMSTHALQLSMHHHNTYFKQYVKCVAITWFLDPTEWADRWLCGGE